MTGFYLKLSEGETVDFPHSILITGRHQFELPLLCSVYLAQRGVAYMGLRAHETDSLGKFSVEADSTLLDRLCNMQDGEFEIGLILANDARTDTVPLVNGLK